MTIEDGTNVFAGSRPVTSDRMNKTVLWRGTTLPTSSNNEIPTDGLFVKTDGGKFYKNTGTTIAPIWELIPSGAITGTILMFTASTIPFGFLLCDGSAVSRTTYAELYALIGTIYGTGDDNTTFNLPDFQSNNRFPRGSSSDGTLGNTGGVSTVTLTGSQSGEKGHSHSVTDPGHIHSMYAGLGENAGSTVQTATQSSYTPNTNSATTGISISSVGSASASSSHENKPPFIDIHFIIAI